MKMVSNIVYILLFIVVIYIISWVYMIATAHTMRAPSNVYSVLMSLLFSFLGFLSSKQWFLYIKNPSKSVDIKLLVVGIIMFVLGLVPTLIWVVWLGLSSQILLASAYSHNAINMLTGIVIGKSFK